MTRWDAAKRRALALAAYLLFVAVIAVWPTHVDAGISGLLARLISLLDFSPATGWISYGVIQVGANVLFFVPVGYLAARVFGGWRWPLLVAVGLAASLSIEWAQTVFLPGRSGDFRDVLANTLGMAIGVLIAVLHERGIRSPSRLAH